jgi:hypothetical protein
MRPVWGSLIEEEVVDSLNTILGNLSCYWQSPDGQIFLGVTLANENVPRVIPSEGAIFDEVHFWIKLPFGVSRISSAPTLDPGESISAGFAQTVTEHFAARDRPAPLKSHIGI